MVAFFVLVIAGVILTLLNWKQGEPIISERFFGCALVFPALVWGVFCCFLYRNAEEWNNHADWWNYLCRDHFSSWRKWSQTNLSILDAVTLTPEIELAERMLGLEGMPPSNTGKVLALPVAADEVPATRLESVLIQLITPFAGTLQRFAGKRTIHIALQSMHEADLRILRDVLQRLEISHGRIAVSFHASRQIPGLLDEWMTNQNVRYGHGYSRQKMMPDLCLLLSFQLNEENTSTQATEAAVALLFASSEMLKDTQLKPKARLFRPVLTAADALPEALKPLIIAEPTPIKRLRNLWISNLPKRDGHVLRAICKDSEPSLTVLDLDQSLGLPGQANLLLMQALAAQAVQYGQGPQLIAMPDVDGLRLNLVGTEYAPVASAKEPDLVLWEYSIAAGLSCLTCLMIILLHELSLSTAWLWTVFGVGVFLLLAGLPAGAILKRRMASDDFHRLIQG